jgi:hypothetical protein
MKFFRQMAGLKTGTLAAMDNAENLLAEIVGAEAFAKLSAVYGGCDFIVPGGVSSERGKVLVELIGAEAAERLIFWGRSSRVYVAKSRVTVRQRRAAEVRELHRQGMTASEISRNYSFTSRYSERAVYKLLSGEKT